MRRAMNKRRLSSAWAACATLGSVLPALPLLAVERLPMAPTPAQPPTAGAMHGMLVDQVIPAYGSFHHQPYRKPSRVEALYNEIREFTGSLEQRAMSGALVLPAVMAVPGQVNRDGQRDPAPVASLSERARLPEQDGLAALLQRLSVAQIETAIPNHFEAWQLEDSWRDLERANDILRMGLSEAEFNNLDQLHRAWFDHYQLVLKRDRHLAALEAVAANPGMSPERALADAALALAKTDYPQMSLDGAYPAVVIPPVLPPPKPKPETASAPPADPAAGGMDDQAVQDALAAAAAAEKVDSESEPTASLAPDTVDEPARPAPTPARGAGPRSEAYADVVAARGRELVGQAQGMPVGAQRTHAYNVAEFVLTEAVAIYTDLYGDNPSDAQAEKTGLVNRDRFSAIKMATSDASKNARARAEADAILGQLVSAVGEAPVTPAPVAPEPAPIPLEPEPAPVPEDEDPWGAVVPPADPAPQEPAPQEPAPVEPDPWGEPAPVEPAPVEPAPVEPAPVEPDPWGEPAPVEPEPELPVEPEPAPDAEPEVAAPAEPTAPAEPAPEGGSGLDDFAWPEF